jgi:hypothetical protein
MSDFKPGDSNIQAEAMSLLRYAQRGMIVRRLAAEGGCVRLLYVFRAKRAGGCSVFVAPREKILKKFC